MNIAEFLYGWKINLDYPPVEVGWDGRCISKEEIEKLNKYLMQKWDIKDDLGQSTKV